MGAIGFHRMSKLATQAVAARAVDALNLKRTDKVVNLSVAAAAEVA